MSGFDLDQIRREYESTRPQYEAFADAIRVLIIQLCKSAGLPVDQVTARAKETASVVAKMRSRNYANLDEMVDKCGVRVITRYESSVSGVCEMLTREFEVIEAVEHGFEAPQSFGYTSRHLILRLGSNRSNLTEWLEFSPLVAEIQVRSILQHAWASISHSLDYKSENETPDAVRRRLYRVAALLETGDELFNAYQRESQELVRTYRTEASTTEWRRLPIDLEAMLATEDRFDWAAIAEVALNAGWRSATEAPAPVPQPGSDNWRDALSVILDIATQAGFKNVGEVSAYAENIQDYEAALQELAARASEDGFEPFAFGPDVIALLIVKDQPERFRVRSEDVDAHFVDPLWIAALGDLGEVA